MANWDILKRIDEQRSQADKLTWEGTFTDYLDIVHKNPKVSDLAHARLYDMIVAAGYDEQADTGIRTYHFFENDMFGLDHVLQHLVEEYLSPASRRLDIRKRILMLVGPVGGGKSTLVTDHEARPGKVLPHGRGRGLRHQRLPDARGAAAS